MNICYTFVQMVISVMSYIILYICTNISLLLSNIDSPVPATGLVNVSSINHIIITNEHVHTFLQIFISAISCIIIYICINISLVMSKNDSMLPSTGLVNLSSINHITKTNEYLHTFVQMFRSIKSFCMYLWEWLF